MPNKNMTMIENVLKESAGMCSVWTVDVKNSVKKVKLRINPVTIPNGRAFPPPTALERTIGRTGKIHGERTVTIPAINEKRMSNNIFYYIV